MSEQAVESDFNHAVGQAIRKEEETLCNASDWSDFKERSGRIKGLKKSLEIFTDLVKHFNDYDEDDDDD